MNLNRNDGGIKTEFFELFTLILNFLGYAWEWFWALEFLPKIFVIVGLIVVCWISNSLYHDSILAYMVFWGILALIIVFMVYSGGVPDFSQASETDLTGTINQPAIAPLIITPKPTATPIQRPTNSGEYYYRDFAWSYDNTKWTYRMGISKDGYNYYRNKVHTRDYTQYALSDYDRTFIQGIVNKFKEAGGEKGYSEYDNVMMVVTFVQSLPYTSDSVTTGFDEYPRYPLETLVDNGGDCEDTAILTAALIREMGYGTVLIQLPRHMAVGVKCSDTFAGTYYQYKGSRYYYLETTGEGYEIGQIPDEYKNQKVTIHPMIQTPRMSISMNGECKGSDDNYFYYRIHCDVENIGSGTATNPVLHIAALAPTAGSNKVWDQETIELDDYQEGATGFAEATVSIPRNSVSQIECKLYGSNFESVEIYSDTFST